MRPAAWLTTVARRRAMDLARREVTLRDKLPLLVDPEPAAAAAPPADAELTAEEVPDDRPRLVFTCCRPALAPDARVALLPHDELLRPESCRGSASPGSRVRPAFTRAALFPGGGMLPSGAIPRWRGALC